MNQNQFPRTKDPDIENKLPNHLHHPKPLFWIKGVMIDIPSKGFRILGLFNTIRVVSCTFQVQIHSPIPGSVLPTICSTGFHTDLPFQYLCKSV
jgi:hypothetical protein